VSVKVFLYAASREATTTSSDPGSRPENYARDVHDDDCLACPRSASFAKLNAARDAFKAFFGTNLPGTTYDFTTRRFR